MTKEPKPLITPGRIIGVLVIVVIGLWLSGGLCSGKKRSADPDRGTWATSPCSSDRDCPAGQRCQRYEHGIPENPMTSGTCTRR